MKDRHKDRCPNCSRFVDGPEAATGYFDREIPDDEESFQVVFCDEDCSIDFRRKAGGEG